METDRGYFPSTSQESLYEILKKNTLYEGKKSFLVFRNNKYVTIQTDFIAFIYIKNSATTIMTFQGQEYVIAHSLELLQELLSDKQFFRINRQYLVNFQAVKEVEHYFLRKLFVKLIIPSPDKLLVGKERSSSFFKWLEER